MTLTKPGRSKPSMATPIVKNKPGNPQAVLLVCSFIAGGYNLHCPFALSGSLLFKERESHPWVTTMDDDKAALSMKLIDIVNDISAISDYRFTVKKQYMNLGRRLKLLTPMFEEIRDSKDPIPDDSIKALAALVTALESAKELLRFGSEGSKIYLVGMAWPHFRFHSLYL
ncbi:hypothetical protein BUALT_Bualt13G0086400 [Buddleja alternifolia]|uniref:RING-type E3 ubiquitin transferase n=1 Tax=Buddleja alternifolia TaxID=168488 RepID=A0AAV6WJZ6_9LAMI|nr:hypothetical protein BUALT_Bualt13G0086400 [Buddleja alternifolia]